MNTERMSQLSEKLLLLSNNRQQFIEYTTINMTSLLADVVKELDSYALNCNIKLAFEASEEELPVNGDDFAIKQAVTNLIDNAIKYNRPGGSVKISANRDGKMPLLPLQTAV
jgi:signal transduction histidine kinase